MARIRILGAALLVGATLLVGASQAGIGTQEAPLRVLFVDSSAMRSNNMPGKVARLARLSGRVLQYRAVLWAGFTLEDHWNFGVAREALASGEWDVLVMLEPYLPEDQEHLRYWVARWADLAREAGTRPALLTVWPDRDRRSAMPDFIAFQQVAAQAAGAQLLPGAEAWQAAWRCGLHRSLYGRDNVHASPLGTYALALVVYGRLYGAPVRSRRLYPPDEEARTARLLQAAAATALGRQLPPGSRCG